jgi:RimJ/RimL family protein N-acetyltransferase
MNAITTHATPSTHRRGGWVRRGRWASIRPIERTDASALVSFYRGLSRRSLHARFLSSSEPDAAAVAALAAAPGYVAVRAERGPRDGEIVGHASIHPDGRGGAEVAFAVADSVQGRGVGTRLMAATTAHARRIGLRRITAVLLVTNGPMRRLLRACGAPVIRDAMEGGTEEVTVDLARAA